MKIHILLKQPYNKSLGSDCSLAAHNISLENSKDFKNHSQWRRVRTGQHRPQVSQGHSSWFCFRLPWQHWNSSPPYFLISNEVDSTNRGCEATGGHLWLIPFSAIFTVFGDHIHDCIDISQWMKLIWFPKAFLSSKAMNKQTVHALLVGSIRGHLD